MERVRQKKKKKMKGAVEVRKRIWKIHSPAPYWSWVNTSVSGGEHESRSFSSNYMKLWCDEEKTFPLESDYAPLWTFCTTANCIRGSTPKGCLSARKASRGCKTFAGISHANSTFSGVLVLVMNVEICFIEKPACDEIERECDEVFVKAFTTCRSKRWKRGFETFILCLRSALIFSLVARSTESLSSLSEGSEMEIDRQVMKVSEKTWMGRRASSLFGLINADSVFRKKF